jgi:hypothetical protein
MGRQGTQSATVSDGRLYACGVRRGRWRSFRTSVTRQPMHGFWHLGAVKASHIREELQVRVSLDPRYVRALHGPMEP